MTYLDDFDLPPMSGPFHAGRVSAALDLLRRTGTDNRRAMDTLQALLTDRHPDDHGVTPALKLANGLSRHRAVRGRPEPTGRTLHVTYNLGTPLPIWFNGRRVLEVFSARDLEVMRGAIAVDGREDGHDGPRVGVITAAEVRQAALLDLYLTLDRGPVQDELLAAAYFGEPIGTSIQATWSPRRTSVQGSQVVRGGVVVQHLAVDVPDPMRPSSVQRAEVPTTPPDRRGARAILGPHAPAPDTTPEPTPTQPAHRAVHGHQPGDQTRFTGRVLSVGSRPRR